MKKTFSILGTALMLAFAMVSCTEKESYDNDTPTTPQHNAMYQTTWSGSGLYTVTVPIIGDFSLTVNNTVSFIDDSNATSYVQAVSLVSLDTNIQCSYVFNANTGTLTAKNNSELSYAFTKTNDTTLNITLGKEDFARMWPSLATVLNYLPQASFSIDLYKQ